MLDKYLKTAGNWLWKKTINPTEQAYWDAPPSSPPPPWLRRSWYTAKALVLRALLPALVWLAVVSFACVGLLLASIWLLGGSK